MEELPLNAVREAIIQALTECVDSDLLDLVYKLLCFL